MFSGERSSSDAHFLANAGQFGEELACVEPGPHDTHEEAPSCAQEEVE